MRFLKNFYFSEPCGLARAAFSLKTPMFLVLGCLQHLGWKLGMAPGATAGCWSGGCSGITHPSCV